MVWNFHIQKQITVELSYNSIDMIIIKLIINNRKGANIVDMSFGQFHREATTLRSTRGEIGTWAVKLRGLVKLLSVSHTWEQLIGQNGCGHCKGMEFGTFHPLNKGVFSFMLLAPLGFLLQVGMLSWFPCIHLHGQGHVDPPIQWTNGLQLAWY